jgi:hypothetical protein
MHSRLNSSVIFCAEYSTDITEWSREWKYARIIGGYDVNHSILIVGNNYGLGDTRKTELLGACHTLGVTRKDRCIVLNHKYQFFPESLKSGHFKIIRKYGGTQIQLPKSWKSM